jgi:hypothetical protein
MDVRPLRRYLTTVGTHSCKVSTPISEIIGWVGNAMESSMVTNSAFADPPSTIDDTDITVVERPLKRKSLISEWGKRTIAKEKVEIATKIAHEQQTVQVTLPAFHLDDHTQVPSVEITTPVIKPGATEVFVPLEPIVMKWLFMRMRVDATEFSTPVNTYSHSTIESPCKGAYWNNNRRGFACIKKIDGMTYWTFYKCAADDPAALQTAVAQCREWCSSTDS